MVSLKSKSLRIVKKRTPGNKVVIHREKRHNSKPHCARCGAELHGIPRNTKGLAKSEKTVNRPFGGHLCSKCAREVIIELSK